MIRVLFITMTTSWLEESESAYVFPVRYNVPVDFSEFLPTKFAACSKPPSRKNHLKASYPRAQQRYQVRVEPKSCDQDSTVAGANEVRNH